MDVGWTTSKTFRDQGSNPESCNQFVLGNERTSGQGSGQLMLVVKCFLIHLFSPI